MENSKSVRDPDKDITFLCSESRKYTQIDPQEHTNYRAKRGLRNEDGTGVVAGVTKICNVHGYVMDEGEKSPVEGQITYRGIDLRDIVKGFQSDDRFGFEESAWLLLFGQLPTPHQLEVFNRVIAHQRELPDSFLDDNIIKCPTPDIMNALQRSTLALYSYDENPEEWSLENAMNQSISIIAKMPIMMVAAHQVKRRTYDRKSMYFHQPRPELSIAENILRTMRSDKQYTHEEAKILDLCMVLHADHGGGNNSTFATRVLTSAATDTYSAISAGIGSLKGVRHGGANHKVLQMVNYIKEGVQNWNDDTEVERFLGKIIDKQVGDGTGLIYGMGHAVYTLSDPRAKMLKSMAEKMVEGTKYEAEYRLINQVEKLTPKVFAEKKKTSAPISANVDLYSGLVYTMLGIPPEMITPMFAVSRTVGWCAHRIEEMFNAGNKIMRPAYKAVTPSSPYISLKDR